MLHSFFVHHGLPRFRQTTHSSLSSLSLLEAISLRIQSRSASTVTVLEPVHRGTAFSKPSLNVDYNGKYASKLLQKAREQGFNSIEDLKEHYNKLLSGKEKSKIKAEQETQSKPERKLDNPTNNLPPFVKPLSSILLLDKIANETPETIQKIWIEYHTKKECLCAVIPKKVYLDLLEQSKKYPMFILPLLRPCGIETYLLQHANHQTHFTTLLSYKLHSSAAIPHLTLTHYTDLIESHNIVLMLGELNTEVGMNTQDARFLVDWMQKFYLTGGEEVLDMVRTFQERPSEFDFERVVRLVRGVEEGRAQTMGKETTTASEEA